MTLDRNNVTLNVYKNQNMKANNSLRESICVISSFNLKQNI